eukprot:3130906-Prymnesium_polylepis.1
MRPNFGTAIGQAQFAIAARVGRFADKMLEQALPLGWHDASRRPWVTAHRRSATSRALVILLA